MLFRSLWLGLGACVGFVSVACSASAPPPARPPAHEPTAAVSAPEPPPPTLPSPTLAAPAGNELAFALDAKGVQIYACQPKEGAFAWELQGPEASLTDHGGQTLGKHYAGPTWELSDGSKVKAKKVAAFTEDATAIPALLLEVSEHEGQGRMSDVSYIQRLSTRHGVAPGAGCDAAHRGELLRSDYTATYYFYRAQAAR